MADGELKYENRKRLFLDFSRQVCPDKDLDNFDKVAANMSIVLFFDVATDGVSHGHVSIANVDTIESEIATFRECDFVKSLLMRPTTRVSIVINGAG
jgi:hypothetical protein